MPTFTACPKSERVHWSDEHGSFWMTLNMADHQLAVFMEAGAILQFNALHDAFIAAGGIPRVSCFRGAVLEAA